MTEKLYKTDHVMKNGKPLYIDKDGKKLEDIRSVATQLYVAGFHAAADVHPYSYEKYWVEAEEFVTFCDEAMEVEWLKIVDRRKREQQEQKEAAALKNKETKTLEQAVIEAIGGDEA